MNPATQLAQIAASANVVVFDNENQNLHSIQQSQNSTPALEKKETINLWQFCRIYTIGNIPIMDFIVAYLVLYFYNTVCPTFNHKFLLIATIPIVIIINLLTDANVNFSAPLLLVFISTLYFLWTTSWRKKNN